MNAQIITTPAGGRLAILPEAEFNALVAAADDAADRAAVARFRQLMTTGEEELVPAGVVDRILGGENRIKVWREHRGMSASSLAKSAGLAQSFLSQLETGKRDGTVETLHKIASALKVGLSDLAG